MRPPAASTSCRACCEEQRRIGARPARLGRREMAADVAGAERAEQRVGDRMQADVGIGMADQPQRVRQPHAEQHEAVARRPGDGRRSRARCAARGPPPSSRAARARSSGAVILRLLSSPATTATAQARGLGERHVVGQRAARHGARARPGSSAVAEALRRLRAAEARALDRAERRAPSATRLSVSVTGSAGSTAGMRRRGRRAPGRSARASTSGRTPSWISTSRGRRSRRLASPRRTDSWRVVAAGRRRQQVEAARRPPRTARGRPGGSPRAPRRPADGGRSARGSGAAPPGRRAADTASAARARRTAAPRPEATIKATQSGKRAPSSLGPNPAGRRRTS